MNNGRMNIALYLTLKYKEGWKDFIFNSHTLQLFVAKEKKLFKMATMYYRPYSSEVMYFSTVLIYWW